MQFSCEYHHNFCALYSYTFMDGFREKAPGQRECDDAIEALNNCIREVDKASLAAISQQLTPRDDISHEVRLYYGHDKLQQYL